MYVVEKLGGVSISGDGREIQFCSDVCMVVAEESEEICDKDFWLNLLVVVGLCLGIGLTM